jgi:hypothetical protein
MDNEVEVILSWTDGRQELENLAEKNGERVVKTFSNLAVKVHPSHNSHPRAQQAYTSRY